MEIYNNICTIQTQAAKSAERQMHVAQIIITLHNFQIQRVGCYLTPLFPARHCAIPYEPVVVDPEPVPGAPEPVLVTPEPIAVAPEPELEDSESEHGRFSTLL